jgi:pimeloyl-ACP methyl ester carboxylesterase/DNA-binding CsgD family transcriptional regulator
MRWEGPLRQSIHFCTSSDGTRIAWALAGNGPALVRAPTWLSHVENDWQSPMSRHWIGEFTQRHTLLRLDPRGIGMSDWEVPEISFEAILQDVEAAVDAARLEKFAMVGNSFGAAVAIAYAARHPERVSRLFLWGSYTRGALQRNRSPEALERSRTLRSAAEIGWGSDEPAFRQLFASLLVPSATREQWTWFTDKMRLCCNGQNAARWLAMMEEVDVQELARQVRCPALVLHSRDEARNPFAEGMRTAELIPDAEFVSLESANHVLLPDEPAWQRLVAEFRRFVHPGAPVSGDFAALTDREREVLELIARGLDNDAIGLALHLSVKTVGNHITRIFSKAGVATRAQAIVRARDAGFGHSRTLQ